MSGEQRTNHRPYWQREEGRRIRLTTPEGVPLEFGLAAGGDRLVAFLVDAFVIIAILIALWLGAAAVFEESVVALVTVATFLVVNFYFMWFEHRWQGRTPGKRLRSLRVVDAGGGRLGVEAVIVRNLTRYVEVVVPLLLLVVPDALWPDAPPWIAVATSVWLLGFGLMPLLNGQRRRVGDMVAGTLVIRAPAAALLRDLADGSPAPDTEAAPGPRAAPAVAGARWTFGEDQLSRYGVYELQVLEEILRNPHPYGSDEAIAQVREKIQRKIGCDAEVDDDLAYLRAFYTAQRAHLERRMLLGQRRADKFDGAPPEDREDS